MSIHAVRTTLKTDIEGVTGGGFTLAASRVVLGIKNLAADNTFLARLRIVDDDAFLQIRAGAQTEQDVQTKIVTYEIQADLWMGLDREPDDDMTNSEKLIEAIKTVLTGKRTMTFEPPDVALTRDPMTVHYVLNFTIPGSC